MRCPKTAVLSFLKKYYISQKPIVLALSGGPDSIGLFHILLSLRHAPYFIDFHVAHVDHSWREESKEEAKILEILCQNHNVPFHLEILPPPQQNSSNLEALGRKSRIDFFKKLCNQYSFQGVVLAHHADDQAETVLKRLFEGSTLLRMGGMKEISQFENIVFWRPWLALPKKNILSFLAQNNISYFVDKTNEDSRFLRTRLRQDLLPTLNKYFGKNICSSLLRISKQIHDLEHFMENLSLNYEKRIQRGPLGIWWDFRGVTHSEFEWRSLLKILLEKEGVTLSLTAIEELTNAIQQKKVGKNIKIGNLELWWDRASLYLIQPKISSSYLLPLKEGIHDYDEWKIEVSCKKNTHSSKSLNGWEGVWLGKGRLFLPYKEKYYLGFLASLSSLNAHSLRAKYSKFKVPLFLRNRVPIIIDDTAALAGEFLTGQQAEEGNIENMLEIVIRR